MSSYKSQYGQDKWIIEEMLPNFKGGYFVDLAAGDGVFLSNTFVLEKEFEWTGICIEPNSTSFKKLKESRSCICDSNVILDDGSKINFTEYEMLTDYEHLLSSVEGTISANLPVKSLTERTTISLNTLLDNHNAPDTIHYISLDIEGSEIYVLQDFLPKSNRKVLYWTIEINPGNPIETNILDWMQAYNYEIDRKDGLNGRLGHDYLFKLKA